jgi:LCP family protein required for cell wall assembly
MKQDGDKPKKFLFKPREKKQPEKRLFHKPVTAVKIIKYCLICAAFTALILAGSFIYVTVINPRAAFPDPTPKPPSAVPAAQIAAEPSSPSPSRTLSPEERLKAQADMEFMKDRVNILFAGIDYSIEREGRTDFRTDTMLLISVNFAAGRADLISVPRDSYADIAFTNNNWKINGAFMSAGGKEGRGFECMMETVSNTLGGVPISHYVAVEMQAVKDIVNEIGGVWYDVDYDIDIGGRHLSKGYQKLDGQAVLDYCRARKGITSGTDIDRIDRQQRLLLSVFSQLKNSMRLSSIPDIYNKVKSGVYTNLNFEQITALTLFALGLDIDTECSRYTLKGEYTTANGHRYYVLDHRYTQKIIREIFGVEPVIDWSYSLEYVKNENARRALKSAVDTLSSFASKHKADLTGAQRDAVEAAIARAKKALKNGGISEMERTADDLTDLYGELSRYIRSLPHSPPPASSEPNAPSPEPTETPSEEPSGPSPEEPVADTQ